MAVKLNCLIRSASGEEEITKTENVSKGGLAVLLKMDLPLGVFVTVICPYSGNAQEMGRKAEVRNRKPHMVGHKRFYGLCYYER